MKFLILGVGSIGSRHIRNLLAMGHRDIIAFDTDQDLLKVKSEEFDIASTVDFEAELETSDAVLICTPPSLHVSAALTSVQKRVFVFIEKPVSNRLSDAKRLLEYEDRIMVGLNLRYHPLVSYVRETLPSLGKIFSVHMEFAYSLEKARPNVDYRKGYYAQKGEGGVLLDHIHELDCAHYLFGRFKEVYCSAAKVSDLEIETEDSADLLLENDDGFSLTLHVDYLQERYARNLKVVAENGVLIGDYPSGSTRLLLNGEPEVTREFPTSFDETYVDEMLDFVDVVRGVQSPVVTVASSLHSLELSEAARASSQSGRTVQI